MGRTTRMAYRLPTKGLACVLLGCVSGAAHSTEAIPIGAWIHDPVISSVDVTPDGRQLAALTLGGINAPPWITVWQTGDLSLPPRRFKPVDVKALSVSWLNDEYLLVVGRQKFDIRVGARPTKWFRNKIYVVDDKGKRFRELFETRRILGITGLSTLPQHKDRFLVQVTNTEFADDVYEVSLKNFVARRVYRGASSENISMDHHGEIRARSELEGSGKDTHIQISYKHPQTGKWEEHHRVYAALREGIQPVAFDNDGRRVYMVDNTGRERSVIRTYDLVTRELGEPLYGGGDIEALNVIQASNPRRFRQDCRFCRSRGKDRKEIHGTQVSIDANAPGRGAAGRSGTQLGRHVR